MIDLKGFNGTGVGQLSEGEVDGPSFIFRLLKMPINVQGTQDI